jgi:hypothetical protein
MFTHRRLCRVKNMLAMYLKYRKAGLTPTTPITQILLTMDTYVAAKGKVGHVTSSAFLSFSGFIIYKY